MNGDILAGKIKRPITLSPEESFEFRSVMAAQNEAEFGWDTFLRTLGPKTFTKSFAPFHEEFWQWYWDKLQRKRLDGHLSGLDTTLLAIWPRGCGKSVNCEWAAIMEGALLGKGYVLYISGKQEMADIHVNAIARRLESPELTAYYPKLAKFKVGKYGNRLAWRDGAIQTASGWGIYAFGLDTGIRGTRLDDLRPTLIVLDDIDDIRDSPSVVEKKIEILTRSVFPAGSKDTIILGAQNLIHRFSVFNQMITGKVKMLTRRTVSGPFPAFDDLVIQPQEGRDVIVGGTPVWKDLDIVECQQYLDRSGESAFRAEYQHDFSAGEQGLVIPEFNDTKHVITWSQFKEKFGTKFIPSHWKLAVGHDLGFTTAHLSAWTFIATAAEDSPMPGVHFLYRGLTYEAPLLDSMAEDVLKRMAPDLSIGKTHSEFEGNRVQYWRMSHEALGERKTYRAKYNIPFQACRSRKEDGITQWRHFLRLDESKPDPFGRGFMGTARLYYIVDDDQLHAPRDSGGLKLHREQVLGWRWRPISLGTSGFGKDEPVKAYEDTCDSTRMITAEWGPTVTPKTYEQQLQEKLPASARDESLRSETDPELLARKHMTWYYHIGKAKKALGKPGHWADEFVEPDTPDDDWEFE